MTVTILIIEDELDFAKSVELRIEEKDIQASVRIETFESGMDQISAIGPAVLVLDLFQGGLQERKRQGYSIFEKRVWGECFSPVIFASASEEPDIMAFSKTHPLLDYIVKRGGESIDAIVDKIEIFLPFGIGINKIKTGLLDETHKITQQALRETTPHTLNDPLNPEKQIPLLENATQRRLAALMRLKSEESQRPIFAWEQYLYPPPNTTHFLTGDVLRSREGDPAEPNNYRVVLSPSCDLAQCKVKSILVGKCITIMERFAKIKFSKKNMGKAKGNLSSILTHAQLDGFVVLPAYSKLIPSMAVSLRDLELMKIAVNGEDIIAASSDGTEFIRVASIDSPFREQLAWAYMEIACRPGMPERNMDIWTDEILGHLPQEETEK